MSFRVFAGVLVSFLLAAQSAHADSVTIYAAASTTDAIEAVIDSYQGGDDITPVFAGSSTLARQIQQGAPADIYLSANEAWMNELDNRGMIEPASRVDLLTNRLVLVTPRLASLEVEFNQPGSLASALGEGRLALADPDGVPAGIYARQALTARGEWRALEDRMVFGDNIRTVLTWVAQAEVDAAIVYRSDALTTMSVEMLGTYPQDTHAPIRYPAGIISGHDRPAVRAFFDYMRGPHGRAIFEDFGFGIADGD